MTTWSHRVAVTGIGMVTAAGLGHDAFWRALFAPQRDGHHRIEDWDPIPWLGSREARYTDRVTQFAVAAAILALTDAEGLNADPDRCGVYLGTGLGGSGTMEAQAVLRHQRGDRRVSPFVIPMMMPNAAAAAVSTQLGWHGPCETTTTACAASTHAIGNAARLVACGDCDAVLAGGTEACIIPTVVAGFTNMRALSRSGRTRHFDINRDGFAIAEGAVILVLEDWDAALCRRARIYGEILGSASTADAYDIARPDPNGTSVVNCIRKVLAVHGLDATTIRQINAHGTGTALNDTAEARAIRTVFTTHRPAVTSTKGATGHALGAAGALEAAAVLLSMHHQVIPPTLGLETPDTEFDLDLITGDGRPWHPGPALSFSFGFGGHNGVLALGPADLATAAT